MIKAYKLYTGDDGHSHVEEGIVAENILHSASSIRFKETKPLSAYDWHPAPRNQYVITLTGTLEFTLFSGETFILQPGEILIALDTTGSGHKWKLVDDDPWKRVYIAIENVDAINFISNNINQ